MSPSHETSLALEPERALAVHRQELDDAVRDLKKAISARLHIGPRFAGDRWRLLTGGVVVGLWLARRRRARLRALPDARRSMRRRETMKRIGRFFTMDELLCRFGLARRRSTFGTIATAVGLVGAGLALGAGLGLLFAPRPGSEVRHRIAEGARHLKGRGEKALGRDNGVRQRPAEDDVIDPSNL